ncbi:DNA-damage-inducible protein d [hydrothermal vent metagenome]|uniref:DNA-damage-inducible protein d n=1 Tax=hydrothermal vent metagenome TaxID=652676 RepID=A0A3B0TMU0_9ZZZZ
MSKKKKVAEIETVHKLAVFKGKQIRRLIHNDEWWFSIVDIVETLTGTNRGRKYWSDLKKKLVDEGYNEVSEKIGQLKMVSPDGKLRLTDCANTETMFRIIQSIPSPKAEPFKRWLAKVGYERIMEIEDPELATKRTRALYKAKGYSDVWIEKRMRSIAIREELTDEWRNRGIQEKKDYAILTAEISKATFEMTPSEYKKFKKLKRENLRDHMNDLELIFSMLGEASTTEIARNKDSQGMVKNKEVARQGGNVAGKARRDLEKKSGKKVSSKRNYLKSPQDKKFLKGKK